MRFKTVLALLCLLLLTAAQATRADEARLLHFPDIYENQVIFVYAGDLWTVATEGGIARKITSFEGLESYPKFSPDGKLIAFTAAYDGNNDVFTVPAQGGEPTRLTFHPGTDRVVEWMPDGKNIAFLSRRESFSYRFSRLFKIPADGTAPESLPLPTAGLASFSADGKKMAYNRMEREHRTWKRYVGGMAQDIWIYDLAKNEIEQMTEFEGTDNFPMWTGDKIYFVSDRSHTANIFCYDLKTKATRQITKFDEYDVKWPSLGKKAIVFENGGYLYKLDLATEKSAKIKIELYDDKPMTRAQYKKTGKRIDWFEIAPDGKRALFTARGDVYTVPAEKGETRNLTESSDAHERYAMWSPDGKNILYLSDKTGEYEFYLAPQDGKGEVEQLTKNGSHYRYAPKWAPDGKKFAYSDVERKLYLFDLESKKETLIGQNKQQEMLDFQWSSDSNWLSYTKHGDNHYGSIYLYNVEKNSSHQATGNLTDDWGASFDPDGNYLYFLSNRAFQPTFSNFGNSFVYKNTNRICVATLRANVEAPFAPESDEVEIKEEKDDSDDTDEKKEDDEKKDDGEDADKDKDEEEPEALKIDISGLDQRVVALPINAGQYWAMTAAKEKVFYISGPALAQVGPKKQLKASFHVFDMKKRENKEVIPACTGYVISADGKKMLYTSNGVKFIADAGKKAEKEGKVNTGNMQSLVDPKVEWAHMFNEAWRLERDYFYDSDMHQVDWEKMRKRYGEMLPYVAHRADLNYLIGEMIAELNCGHAYVRGGEMPHPKRVSTGLLGCDFVADGKFYKFAKIYSGENWDDRGYAPLTQPGVIVKPGMYLIAVNGQPVRTPDNINQYFTNLSGKQVEITVNSTATEKDAKTYVVKPITNDQYLRYLDWIETNRQKVAKATNGKVGYLHVPDTMPEGFSFFTKGFMSQIDKAGMVVDARYNSGGLVPDRLMEYMRRPMVNMWYRRHAGAHRYPQTAMNGHFVCLTNAWAGSGGDLFPWYFKKYQLGELIGKRTWGGLVGYSGVPRLIDGGGVTAPNYAFFNLEREWDVEGHGVDPTIEVDNRPDLVINGRDPQLEKAIEVVLKQMKDDPKTVPERPKFPNKK